MNWNQDEFDAACKRFKRKHPKFESFASADDGAIGAAIGQAREMQERYVAGVKPRLNSVPLRSGTPDGQSRSRLSSVRRVSDT